MMIKLIYPMILLLIVLQSCKGQTNPVSDKIETSSTANHKIEKNRIFDHNVFWHLSRFQFNHQFR